MSKLYLEILDPERKKIFKKLSSFKKDGVLAGGTGLALQIGHRKSFDFDIFLPKPIPKRFFRKVVEVFGGNLETRVSTGDILLVKTPEDVEIHFVYVWYKGLFEPVKTSSLKLSAVGDIVADKAYTIGRRGQWRDYVDIFFLLKRGLFSLEEIIKMTSEKYDPEFNPRLFLEQLAYYGDIRDFSVTFFKESYTVDEIKQFLTNEAEKFEF